MADLGTAYSDAALADIEKQLKSVYNKAYTDMLQKQKDFNAAYAKKEAMYQAKLNAGQITQDQFDSWKKGQVFQGEQWQAKKKQILNTLYSSNDIATKIVNGQMTNVFAFNANYQAFNLEHGAGINFGFGLYDSATVVNLIKNNPKLLPEWKIDKPKDYKWNQKKLNRQINLGIIEGESLDTIAKRLCGALSTQNFNHMRTFARTAMTGAQNAGREFSLQAAQDKGIKLKKEWMCTLDGHTRTNHRLLDGQKRPLDKPFEAGGMKIRYPGDPEAHPSMVYNCRCTMVADLEDYPATYDRYDNIDGKPIKNMSYDDWINAKAAGTDINPVPLTFTHKHKSPDELMALFGGKKMSNVYKEIKDLNTTEGNKFYKELQQMGKPSEVWQQYLDGTLPAAQAEKIDELLHKYAEKAGLLKNPVNIAEQFLDKKMSHVYADIKSIDTTAGNKFYKELQQMGKPSEVWQQYLNGELTDEQNAIIEKYLQKYYGPDGKLLQTTTKGVNAAKAAAKAADDIDDAADELKKAQKKLEAAQKEVDNLPDADKVFKGIWKDDVTYADYEAKKASIQAKKDYYFNEIEKAKQAGDLAKANKLQKFLDELEDFEKNGENYSKKLHALQKAQDAVKKLTPTASPFDPSVYDDAAKNAAKKFTSKNAADKFHRDYLDSIWDDLTDEEKYGVWEYTRNSNPMNKSLSGYHDSWSRSSFIGPDRTDWGHEDPWRSIPSAFKKYGKDGHATYHKAITNTTKAIDKSALPEGVHLVRGSDINGFAGLIENGPLSFDEAKNLLENGNISSITKALEGQVIQNHAFTSTGIASGTGFSGDIAYRIYAPKGTKAIYAEPQSYFGNTVGSHAKLYRKGQAYSSVGNEAEVILQRGTSFRITGIEEKTNAWGDRTFVVNMEVIDQPDYFRFGDEDTFNGGKTRHKK